MLTEMKIKITVTLLDDMMNYVIPYEKVLLKNNSINVSFITQC